MHFVWSEYLQVGANTMDNPLLKYSAKEYFFKASLCHFIVDELNAKASLELCGSVPGSLDDEW